MPNTPPIPPDPAPTKSLVKSKTLIVNAIIALAALNSHVQAFVQAHPLYVLEAVTYANVLLRFATHSRISLFGSDS